MQWPSSYQISSRLVDEQHYLRNISDHNHAAEASRLDVIRTIINTVKERARETSEQSVQIIQTMAANTSREIHSYLPSRDALRQTVKRLRRSELPTEPESLDDFVIPENLTTTYQPF